MPRLDIAIVGGGIGGPCAAIGLAQNGHSVTLYERATTTGGVGFAFRIMPNADRCLKSLGIDTNQGGAVIANSSKLMSTKGEIIAKIRENADIEKAKKGASVFAYRPTLHHQLLDRVREVGVVLKTGVKVTLVDVEKTTLTLDDGSTVSADLIIAADGVHSVIRPIIVDSEIHHPKMSTGHNCLRLSIPKQTILDDPIASKTASDDFRMFTWKGDDKRIIAYAVDNDRQYNLNATHPEWMSRRETSGAGEQDAEKAIAYNHAISLARIKEIYAEFDPLALRLFELADPKGFRVWNLLDMDEIPRWSARHTVLIGDACHPVVPFGFSGAGMAIEDAVTLAALLPADVRAQDISVRLELFERIRRPRVARVRETSRLMSNSEDLQMMKEYREFLSEFDAVECAKQELAKEVASKN